MEDFSRYLGFNRTLALICCIFHIFLQADGNSISETAGRTVTLHCYNESIIEFTQLTWKRNGDRLFTFKSDGTSNSSCVTLNSSQKASNITCVRFPAAAKLNLNMSTSKSQLHALIIENAQENHSGNYTCEISTPGGVSDQKWELVITEETENPFKIHIAVVIIVPIVCILIFIITALIILGRACKQRSQNTTQSPTVISQEQVEDIYENTLELEAHLQRSQRQVHPYKYKV